jgi:hypothetical protein
MQEDAPVPGTDTNHIRNPSRGPGTLDFLLSYFLLLSYKASVLLTLKQVYFENHKATSYSYVRVGWKCITHHLIALIINYVGKIFIVQASADIGQHSVNVKKRFFFVTDGEIE